jgi:type IX secretion system PorP/SprF family membrane protein
MLKHIKVLFLLIIPIIVSGQDMIYDLTYANRLIMNPAFAGNDGEGKVRASVFHHNQYVRNRGPFRFSSASIDYGICETPTSVGLILQNETQGDGQLSINSAGGVIGHTITFGRNSSISAGLNYTIYNYSVDWNRYVFSDQLDPIRGVVFASSNTNAMLITENTHGLNIGASYTAWKIRRKRAIYAFNVGASYHHGFITPRASLLQQSVMANERITIHGSTLIKKRHNLIDNATEISFRFDQQAQFSSSILQIGKYMNDQVFLGLGLRSNLYSYENFRNSIKPLLELRLLSKESGLQINAMYGYNAFSNSTGLGGSYEIGLVWVGQDAHCTDIISGIFRGRKSKSKYKRMGCPSFNEAMIEVPRF